MPACLRISFRYLSIFTLPSCILLANKIKVFQKNHATISANLSYPMTADPAMFQIASFPSSRISSTSSRTSSVPVIMLAQKSHIVKSLFIFLIFLLLRLAISQHLLFYPSRMCIFCRHHLLPYHDIRCKGISHL
ncbi:unknown [Firmicutes bacterium CAG:238]|nr:unknown [Firmicutes bacterium CAG:238]